MCIFIVLSFLTAIFVNFVFYSFFCSLVYVVSGHGSISVVDLGRGKWGPGCGGRCCATAPVIQSHSIGRQNPIRCLAAGRKPSEGTCLFLKDTS